ncbi:oligosaccharide repeat unit polymerase [Pseudomonas veronii]|uniref:O-antigen polymerase n=1 Tax=Pseudomonas TaxID=286 RepID=UPI000F81A716|nr:MULTISPECIES: O-antigen polymerase [Pseudomonas]MDY7551984.1 O-antigen polymerase [Pseudomonas sp. FG1]MEB0050608.1 O-antigen polymerase [Pseudomonas sp. FG1]RTY65689.1 oligosaccharide repeat unit polymerase [Pseudomonas veronii]
MGRKKNTWLVTFSPLSVLLLVWGFQWVYYEVIGTSVFNPILSATWWAVSLALAGYALGSVMVVVFTRNALRRPDFRLERSFFYFKSLCFILAMWVVLDNLVIPVAAGHSVSELRNQAIDEWTEGGVAPRVLAVLMNGLACSVLFVISINYEVKNKFSFFWALVYFLLCIACFSRTLLLIGMAIILLRVLLQGKNPLRVIFISLIGFIVLFLALAWLMKDHLPGEDSVVDVLVRHVEVYFFGGVSGLNYYVKYDSPHYDTLLTMPRFIQGLFSMHMEMPPSYFDFVETPGTLNVFTSIFPPYHDFGGIGVFIFFGIYGLLSTAACVLFVRTGKFLWQVIAGFTVYATAMSIFDDQFLRGLPVFLILAFFAWLLDLIRGRMGRVVQVEYQQ